MYWFIINKILMEQEFNFLNGINKLFHKELCLLPKRGRCFYYQIMSCPAPVPVERLSVAMQVDKAHSFPPPLPADSPTLISTVQLVQVSNFSFCSSCFSYWTVASSYLNIYINFLGFLLIWDIRISLTWRAVFCNSLPLPSQSLSPSSWPLSPCPGCQEAERASCPAREAETSSRVKAGRGGTVLSWAQSHSAPKRWAEQVWWQ